MITTGSGADYVSAGGGADTITSGAGGDRIVLTETTSAADTVVFNLLAGGIATNGDGFDGSDSDGVSNALTEDLTETTTTTPGAGVLVTGFNAAADKVKIDGTLEAALEASAATVRITAAGWDFNAAGIVIVDNGVATVADFGDQSAVATAIDTAAAGSNNAADGDEFIIVLANAANTAHGVYYFKDADATSDLGMDVGDSLSLVGVITLTAAGDLAATSVAI